MDNVRFFKRVTAVVIGASLVFGGVAAGVGSITPVASAQSDTAASETTAVVDVDALNVRSSPSLSGTIITTLYYNTRLHVFGDTTTADGYIWYQVRLTDGSTGWAVHGFIIGAGESLPTPTTPTTGGFVYGDTVVVVTDLLNVRSLPSISASVLDVYGYGTVATVTGPATVADGYTWYAVDNLGWVAGQYLTVRTPGGDGSDGGAPDGYGDESGDYVIVITDALNVRSTPSTSASILDVLLYHNGAFISGSPVTADGYTWYPINNHGWVAGQYIISAYDAR